MSKAFAFPEPPSPKELSAFPLNDLGNGMRLIRLVGGVFDDVGEVDHACARLLYLRRRGWIAFNGRNWDLESGEDLARRYAHQVARGLIAQGEFMRDIVGAKPWMDFVNRTGSSGATAAMLAQAASYLTVDLDAFDQQPLTLNVRNGTLKFKRNAKGVAEVIFQATHDPADRITRFADVDYDPKAKAPMFEGHVAFCQPSPDMRDYLRALFGYVFTGSTKEQLFIILQGKGGDGKSTLVNALKSVGGGYAFGAAVETFLDTGMRRSSEASPDLARLAGDTRMICTAEPPGGAKLASGQIKAFTGGGTIIARELRQGIFEFQPIGKVVLECNRRPVVNDTDAGIWRRMRIILFKHQVAPEAIDLDLPEKLNRERPGILNWIVQGVLDWMDKGLVTPPEVLEAIEDYRRGANPFAEWMAERVELDASALELASVLYGDYKAWCEDNGHERPMTQTTFGRALGDLQVLRAGKDSSGKLRRKGAKLKRGYVAGGDDPADAFGAPSHAGPGPGGQSRSAPSDDREPGLDPDLGDWEGS